ncbi:type II toxin-antitoxin system prevent-host-death family antitoxin [Corynebacterium uropygiale]|uniref:Antitoxin n=1 Tax=Corynebacterium uropygiale TaxID=1775911 RepID=A0A9X1U6E1_9CORY|nr:type II toxin-antitoxin system prevent-host-death family antitoxin [Corynebacterium uropygiale]MCF4005617.1 type II toxin-antitoxin system prevent-host-death family antitoxin [Corynebacterium uropygiale]
MRTMSYSESRAHYAEALSSAVDDHEEVIITRSGKGSAVLLSLDDYNSLVESAYLMRSPRNAQRLLEAVERLNNGEGISHDLLEADE